MNQLISSQLIQKIALQAAETDHDGSFPEQEFEWIREAALLSVVLPGATLSFTNQSTSALLNLLKNIGRASLPVGRVYEGHVNALYLIHLFGNSAQKDYWFAQAASKKLFGVWNTQDGQGIKIHDLGNGRYQLEGAKTFCSGAHWLNFPLITGELISTDKKGWQMCIIPNEKAQQIKADSSFWKPLGMKASASFRMDFTGIELTEEDLFGAPDAYYQQPYFSGGAIRFAAVQLGGAEAILAETQQFLRNMKRIDDAFQQARVAEMAYLIESGNLWLNQAGNNTDQWLNEPEGTERILAYANMTRTVIEDICLRVMHLAERSVGSRGLMRPQAMERIHRDLTTYLRQPAPDATLTAIGSYVLHQDSTQNLWNNAAV